jgi:ABC-type branched-subunit amino acid transport system ATPase component
MKDLLEIQSVSKSFGGLKAVNQCSFVVKKNSITGLIGPNGAGKTTMFNIISGLITADSGSIHYKDKNITKSPAHTRANLGLGRTYQAIRIFQELTALENIIVAFKENKEKLWHSFINHRKNTKNLEKKAMKLLESVNLQEKSNLKGYELSYGQKKLLEILRIKANNTDLVLLDEPTAGINPTLIKQVTEIIRGFQKDGKTILIVEHNMPFIMGLCEQIIVMDRGANIAEGKPRQIQNNPQVLEAYLGSKK